MIPQPSPHASELSVPQSADLLAAQPLVIVTFGASATEARGVKADFSNLLACELSFDGKDIKVINAGIGGNTTRMGKKRLESDVLAAQPDVVVMMFGINDAAVDVWETPPATTSRVSLEEYRENLTAMIQALKQRGTRVVLMTTNPTYWAAKTIELYGKPPYKTDEVYGFSFLLSDYAAAAREIARQEGVGLVDNFAAFEAYDAESGHEPGSLTSDGMHPNNAGHRIIADLLIELFTQSDHRFVHRP